MLVLVGGVADIQVKCAENILQVQDFSDLVLIFGSEPPAWFLLVLL